MENRPYNFRITNERKNSIIHLLSIYITFILFLLCVGYLKPEGISFGVFMFFIIIFFIHFYFAYTNFNSFKINIIEMILGNSNVLTINYYFLKKINKVSHYNMNDLQFRVEPTLANGQEFVIHDNNYKRLFKVREGNGMEGEDLSKIVSELRNSGIKELERTGFDKKTFKDSLKIIKVNYLSKDVFRNFWYV